MALTDTSEEARDRQLAVYATTPDADKILLDVADLLQTALDASD